MHNFIDLCIICWKRILCWMYYHLRHNFRYIDVTYLWIIAAICRCRVPLLWLLLCCHGSSCSGRCGLMMVRPVLAPSIPWCGGSPATPTTHLGRVTAARRWGRHTRAFVVDAGSWRRSCCSGGWGRDRRGARLLRYLRLLGLLLKHTNKQNLDVWNQKKNL